jgi:hypothetical protein
MANPYIQCYTSEVTLTYLCFKSATIFLPLYEDCAVGSQSNRTERFAKSDCIMGSAEEGGKGVEGLKWRSQ